MPKRSILIQLDTDPQPSVFDAVVAADADVDVLLRHGGVNAENAEPLVHGAMFTRGPGDLHRTAIFVGGSDVNAGEEVFRAVNKTFFGPLRASTMLDSNGANTTAAAAVLAVLKHAPTEQHSEQDSKQVIATVLGGTGPVGQRVARLLAGLGYIVRLGSRSRERAEATIGRIRQTVTDGQLEPVQTKNESDIAAALEGSSVLVSAGAIGVQMAANSTWRRAAALKVAVDLNAAPPGGLEGIDAQAKGQTQDGIAGYGALGVGGVKMKIHKACLRKLFESNDQALDAEEILAIGSAITA